MAYTSPKTWAAGLVTASDLNTQLRDNLVAINAGALALPSQATGDWMQASSATAWARVQPFSPLIGANVTPVGNVGTGIDLLQSLTLPAGLLATNGWGIEVVAAVAFMNNSNTKQAWIYFGASAVAVGVQGAWNNVGAILRATIVRTGATTQVSIGDTLVTGTGGQSATYNAPAETLSGAIAITTKGEATSNDDVVSKFLMARLIHVP